MNVKHLPNRPEFCSAAAVLRHWLAFGFALGLAHSARAQGGPFFEPSALDPQGYELRISAEYRDIARDDFSRPMFLIAQPVERLTAREFLLNVDLRLSITPSLAVQLVLPWIARRVDIRSFGLQVSADRTLRPQSLDLSGGGLGDPLLALAYRFFRQRPWAAYAEIGATIPIDDNPGSPVVPERVPLSTGQHEIFAGAGATLERPIALSLSYRFGYSPGEHAAFLIRRVGTQSYTSGAFGPFAHHRVLAAAAVSFARVFSAVFAPAWTFSEHPTLVERGGRRQVVRERGFHELSIAAGVRVQLGHHRLELRYTQPLTASWDVDPLFPIVIPARGAGITWQLVGS